MSPIRRNEVGEWLDIVELCRGDEGADRWHSQVKACSSVEFLLS